MTRQVSKSKKKGTTEKSLADYISSANKRLTALARSKRDADRIRALNILIFILVLSLIITYFFIVPTPLLSFGGLISLFIWLIVSLLIGVYGYASFLDVLVPSTAKEIASLRLGTNVLLAAYPLAFVGVIFGVPWLIYSAFILIPIQVLMLFVYSMFGVADSEKGNHRNHRGLFEGTTGIFSLVISIVDIIVTLASIIISVTLH